MKGDDLPWISLLISSDAGDQGLNPALGKQPSGEITT